MCARVCFPLQAQVTLKFTSAVGQCKQFEQRARCMFSGGEPDSGPKRSGVLRAASEASDGLLVDAMSAVKAVTKACNQKGCRKCNPTCTVHRQCPVLDKEEMLGYLVADILGLPVIPQPYARSVGESARLRANKVTPAIDAAARRLDKASDAGAAAAAQELDALRRQVVVELALPSRRACAAAECEAMAEPLPERVQGTPMDTPAQPDPIVLAEACLKEAQQSKWDADARLKVATRALARLRPPPNFKGERAEYNIHFWLAGSCSSTEQARRDALREDLWAAEAEHREAKHAMRRAARELVQAQALVDGTDVPDASENSFSHALAEILVRPDPCQETREKLDRQWEELKRQREEDAAFTRTCEARREAGNARVAALRAECESAARDETRRMLYGDAERVWGPYWQSR